jgi:hypothetical protein
VLEMTAGPTISPEAEDKEEWEQPSCKVNCKEALTTAETLLYFMKNQDDVHYVDLFTNWWVHMKNRKQNRPTEKSNKNYELSDKMTLRKNVYYFFTYVSQCEYVYFYVQICICYYFAYIDDDNSNKIHFALTMFFNYPGPCFPQLSRIIGALLRSTVVINDEEANSNSWLLKFY